LQTLSATTGVDEVAQPFACVAISDRIVTDERID
jgi:hypothetical protein